MKIFWWGLFLIHVAAGLYQIQAEGWRMADSQEYLTVAENVLEHQTCYSADMAGNVRMHHYSKRPPLYPFFLLLCQLLFGSPFFICLCQIGASMGSIWLAWKIWGLLRPQRPNKRLLLPFLLLYPAQWMYSQLIMTEIMFQFWVLSMAYLLLLIHLRQSYVHLWMYTAVLILSMLTKPVMYLFWVPHLILLVFWAIKWKKIYVLLPAFLPLLFVVGFSSWNQERTGHFHYSSIQNLSLLQYTTHNLLTQVYGADSALVLSDSIHYAVLDAEDYASGQQLLQTSCVGHISDHLFQYSLFHAKGMINFFLDPGRFDLYHFWGLMEPGEEPGFLAAFSKNGYQGMWQYLQKQAFFWLLLLLLIALMNGLKLLGLILVAWNRHLSWIQKFLLTVFILYIGTLTGTSGASRFAIPVFPLLLVCTALSIEQIKEWKKRLQSS
ncbi:MAG: hypothetical protein AAF587_16245 [Bacteroidota bacterium]